MKQFVAILISFLIFGCATTKQYDGPDLSVDEIAILHVEFMGGAIVKQVNNKWRGLGLVQEYHFKPGKNQLTVAYQEDGLQSSNNIILSFDAEAGKEYRLEAVTEGQGIHRIWKAEIKEVATNKVVSKVEGYGVPSFMY